MNRLKRLAAVTGIAVAVTIAAACGNGADSSSADASPETVPTEAPSVGEPASVAPAVETSSGSVAISIPPPASVAASQASGAQQSVGQPVLVAGGAPGGISVTGEGTITLEPDLVVLNVGVETTGDTVAAASSEAADAMNAIVGALNARGIGDRDIQTRFFDISPQYEFAEALELGVRTRKQVLIGYRVSNSASVKVRDLDATGSIIDEVAEAGGDSIRINGIRFTVEDPKPYTLDLREAAIKDAIDKAQHLAGLAGVSLGRLVFITESSSGGPIIQEFGLRSIAAFAEAAPAPIGGGELELRMSVQAMFEIS